MDNNTVFVIGISLLILIITILIFIYWNRRGVSRRSLLLLGLTESGKTALFARLLYSTMQDTYTSIKENIGNYSTDKGTIRIIDIPGHERVRGQIFDKYKSSALGLAYLVDSVTIQVNIRDVAEYLYTILTDPVIQKSSPSLLIVCNKQDQPMAKSTQIIKSILEKEINVVRKTKSSQLEAVGSSPMDAIFLGKKGKDFEFSHLNINVEIIECSISDTVSFTKWLSKIA